MRCRPLALALSLALLPLSAQAEDLLQTYQIARGQDPQLAAAEANQRSTAENQVQARAAMLPQIGANASISRQRQTNRSGEPIIDPDTGQIISGGERTSDSTSRSASIGVDQMVFNGATISRHRAQKLYTEAGEYDLESANDQLITRTSRAYFDVLVAMETLAAAEAQEEALKKQFDFADKRLEVGLAPITDVHEARAQYEAARANTILRRNALEDAYQALAEITGQPIRSLMALPDDFVPQLPAEGGAEDWVNRAVDNNPALAAQKTRLAAAEQNIRTARAGHLPTLNARGSYGISRTNSSTDILGGGNFDTDGRGRGPSVSLSLSVPIFSGGAVQSQVRQAIAQRDVVEQQLEQQKRGLERNTRSAYQNLAAGISALEARRLALVAAQSAYDASQVGLEVGTRTVIDVLINQQNLFNAQQAYAEAKYNYLQSHLLLRQAAGELDIGDVQAVNRLLTVPAGQAPRINN
ncbi:TolC family outer membrane protein [Luteimonas sp. e5]